MPLRFYGGMGLTLGGDKIASVTYTNGSESDINAGHGVQPSGGIDYRWSETFSMQMSIGYNVSGAFADNGDVSFSRWPIEVLGYLRTRP